MPRVRQVPRDEAPEGIVTAMYQFIFGDRDPVAEPGLPNGTTGDWWTVVAQSPELLEHCVGGAAELRLGGAEAERGTAALVEAGDAHHRSHYTELLTWQRWLTAQGLGRFEPKRWLSFNYAHQIAQAALTGQGVALVRTPLIAESLASGDLIEPFPGSRLDSPLAYWLIVGPRNAARPEVLAFCDWLKVQATQTREAIGEVPDPETVDNID